MDNIKTSHTKLNTDNKTDDKLKYEEARIAKYGTSDYHDNFFSNYTRDNSSSKNLDRKNELKNKKIQRKREKHIKKEDEIRKNILLHKGQQSQTVNPSCIDSFNSSDNKSKLNELNEIFKLSCRISEFPDLQTSIKKQKIKKSISFSSGQIAAGFDSSSNKSKTEENNTDCIKLCNEIEISKKSKKNRKKCEPIVFDLMDAIQMSLIKQKKSSIISNVTNKSLKNKILLSGNGLDSDNPIRKRGKFRENKKKRITKLKQAILKERMARKKNSETSMKFLNSFELKLTCQEIIIYSSSFCGLDLSNPNGISNSFTIKSGEESKLNADTSSTLKNMDINCLIHSRKFRSYCDQWPDEEMKINVANLIKKLVYFQDRLYKSIQNRDYMDVQYRPKIKQRYVCGFRQIMKYVDCNKAKLVIIATDLEDGVQDVIYKITNSCDLLRIPYVFSCSRWSLKKYFKKPSQISGAAILMYDGAEDLFKNIISLLPKVKSMYADKLNEAQKISGNINSTEEDLTTKCIQSMLKCLTMNDTEITDSDLNSSNKNSYDSDVDKIEDNNSPSCSFPIINSEYI